MKTTIWQDCTNLVTTFLALVFLLSCEADPLAPARGTATYNYNWGLSNFSDRPIREVNLYLVRNGRRFDLDGHTVLPPEYEEIAGSAAGSVFTPVRVPTSVLVTWKSEEGVPKEQVVSLVGLVDPDAGDFMGRIWLKYRKGVWTAVALTPAQLRLQVPGTLKKNDLYPYLNTHGNG